MNCGFDLLVANKRQQVPFFKAREGAYINSMSLISGSIIHSYCIAGKILTVRNGQCHHDYI